MRLRLSKRAQLGAGELGAACRARSDERARAEEAVGGFGVSVAARREAGDEVGAAGGNGSRVHSGGGELAGDVGLPSAGYTGVYACYTGVAHASPCADNDAYINNITYTAIHP
jgi:hypothetical protein